MSRRPFPDTILPFADTWASSTQLPAPVTEVLHPGDVAVAPAGNRLETLLGSCVSIILTDARQTVGAMCHIVHASEPQAFEPWNTSYARPAVEAMQEGLVRFGMTPKLCVAHLFGGGNMFPDTFSDRHVGAANVRWAHAYLRQLGIAIRSESTGGSFYRKVAWTVGQGAPSVQLVAVGTDASEPASREA